MKILFLLLTVTATIVTFAKGAWNSSDDKTTAVAKTGPESPFACDRKALDPAARKRHFDELGPALDRQIIAVRELPDGYEFQFPADPPTIQQVAEWAAGERLCCPFFDIALEMNREGGPFWLRLTGRQGTKTFIETDGASWLKHPRSKG